MKKFMLTQKQPTEMFCEKRCSNKFRKILRKNLCQSLLFNKVAGLIKKETLAQVFSCEFCEICKSTIFIEDFWWLRMFL